MDRILLSFLAICLMRLRPQDLPAAPMLAALATILYVIAGMAVATQNMSFSGAAGLVLVDTVVFGVLIYLLLWVRDLQPRFLQTYTALLGASSILELIAAPLLYLQAQGLSADGLTAGAIFASLLLWLWLFWSLLVIGHVVRHAIDTALPIGVMIGMLYMFITFSITRTVFFASPPV